MQVMAKIEPVAGEAWKADDIAKLAPALKVKAPGVLEELQDNAKQSDGFLTRNGLAFPMKRIIADGPRTKFYLDKFCAKASMAAFMELCSRPINLDGILFTEWYLNAGLTQENLDINLSIMPMFGQLTQGKKVSGKQFQYRYNTNGVDTVAAMFSFHGSFHLMTIACDNRENSIKLKGLFEKLLKKRRTSQLTRPGLLAVPYPISSAPYSQTQKPET